MNEYVPDGDWNSVRRNFERLSDLDTGGQSVSIRFGRSSIDFTASTDSSSTTVDHGLGKEPLAVVATAYGASTHARFPALNTGNYTATQFDIAGRIFAVATETVIFNWIAIG
jgi:hypothetical protein